MIFLLLGIVSPFYIDYPPCKSPTQADYLEIDRLKNSQELHSKIEAIYKKEANLLGFSRDEFAVCRNAVITRINMGSRYKLADPTSTHLPEKRLVKINEGGDFLVVSYADFGERRPKRLLERMQLELERSGFNGYFYYLLGGYPTPRGIELNYSSTPYAFKIFIMEEAKKLGFKYVLWLDSRLIPLKNITPLFNMLKQYKGLFNLTVSLEEGRVFKQARESILELTKTDIFKNRTISTPVFGLRMDEQQSCDLIDDFYLGCTIGLPFFSCYPEETLLSALIAKHFPNTPFISDFAPKEARHLFYYSHYKQTDQKIALYAKKMDYYFFGISNEGVMDIFDLLIPLNLKGN
ncbi:MAG: hypothetical protein ACOYK9_02800 [Chlamydiia bacterium]